MMMIGLWLRLDTSVWRPSFVEHVHVVQLAGTWFHIASYKTFTISDSFVQPYFCLKYPYFQLVISSLKSEDTSRFQDGFPRRTTSPRLERRVVCAESRLHVIFGPQSTSRDATHQRYLFVGPSRFPHHTIRISHCPQRMQPGGLNGSHQLLAQKFLLKAQDRHPPLIMENAANTLQAKPKPITVVKTPFPPRLLSTDRLPPPNYLPQDLPQ